MIRRSNYIYTGVSLVIGDDILFPFENCLISRRPKVTVEYIQRIEGGFIKPLDPISKIGLLAGIDVDQVGGKRVVLESEHSDGNQVILQLLARLPFPDSATLPKYV